jgi:hypothetical protein
MGCILQVILLTSIVLGREVRCALVQVTYSNKSLILLITLELKNSEEYMREIGR